MKRLVAAGCHGEPHAWRLTYDPADAHLLLVDAQLGYDCVLRIRSAGFDHPWDPGTDRVAEIPPDAYALFASAIDEALAARGSEVASEVQREARASLAAPWVRAIVESRTDSDRCTEALRELRDLVRVAVVERRPHVLFDL